jgi:hypothetical protein
VLGVEGEESFEFAITESDDMVGTSSLSDEAEDIEVAIDVTDSADENAESRELVEEMTEPASESESSKSESESDSPASSVETTTRGVDLTERVAVGGEKMILGVVVILWEVTL